MDHSHSKTEPGHDSTAFSQGSDVAASERTVSRLLQEREFFIDNLLVRIHFMFVMIRWTGLVTWGFAFPFTGSLTSTFLGV